MVEWWNESGMATPVTNITQQALEWKPQGLRVEAFSKTSWRRTMQKEYEDIGMSLNEVKRTAQNRVRWKAAVEALCSDRSEEE